MKTGRRVRLGVILAGLLLLAGFLLRGWLLAHFVRPMALLLWSGSRLAAAIDQSSYWVGLILGLIAAVLVRLLRQQALLEGEPAENGNATLHSIGHWRTLILLTSSESDRLNLLKNAMQKLLKEIYASKQPSERPWKIYQEVEQGEVTLPGRVRKFLMLDPPNETRPTLMQQLRRASQAPVGKGRRWTKQERDAYYQSIAEVISFMETELENEDGQPTGSRD